MAVIEQPQSPIEIFDPLRGWEVTRVFVVDKEDVQDLVDKAVYQGEYIKYPGCFLSGLAVVPQTPKNNNVVYKTADALLAQVLEYDKYKVTIDYSSSEDASDAASSARDNNPLNTEKHPDSEIIFTYSADGDLELFTRSPNGVQFLGDPGVAVPEDVRATVARSLINHKISVSQLDSIDWEKLSSISGCVNKTPFVLPVTQKWCAPEVLLFGPFQVSTEVSKANITLGTELKWKLDLNVIEKYARQCYGGLNGVPYDILGTFNGRTTYQVKRYYQYQNDEFGNEDFDNYLYVPPGWNEYWRNKIDDTNWIGWDYLTFLPDNPFGVQVNKPYPLYDFNLFFYNRAIGATPDSFMDTRYPARTFGAW